MKSRGRRVRGKHRFQRGENVWPKHSVPGLLVTLQQQKTQTSGQNCCATGGVNVHTKGSEIEEGATVVKGEKGKRWYLRTLVPPPPPPVSCVCLFSSFTSTSLKHIQTGKDFINNKEILAVEIPLRMTPHKHGLH